MEVTRKGIIQITSKTILNFLEFPYGKVLDARVNEFGVLEICIQDDEMPEVRDGNAVPVVCPLYTRQEDSHGRYIITRNPLKKT